jgi:uncharacterized protein
MSEPLKLNRPWLIAVWPGMGHVAISAGYYLMAKLGMHVMAEFSPRELFDIEHVEVNKGIIMPGRLPRSRLFVWNDPQGERDIVVFIGEAQPPLGKYAFCRKLIEFAQQVGVERVFTFAAMATPMHPQRQPRVFCAATSEQGLADLQSLDLQVLNEGQIGGLNGILLGAAAEAGMNGACLLGELPHILAQVPFPAASLSVLRAFQSLAGIDVDLVELTEQAQAMNEKLGELLAEAEHALREVEPEGEEEFSPPMVEPRLSDVEEARIERLFDLAHQDKSKAYELKQELDRLEVFAEYEDRFLDLFKKDEPGSNKHEGDAT